MRGSCTSQSSAPHNSLWLSHSVPRRWRCAPCSASTASDALTERKAELRQTIRSLEQTSSPDLRLLAARVDALNKLNPTPNPSESPLINGTWVLLYTAKLNEAARGENLVQALSGALYEQIYRYLPVLGGSAVGRRGSGVMRSRGNFQAFDLSANEVINEARFEVPGLGQECAIRVEGTAEVVPGSRGDCPSRLKATFTSFSLLLGGQEKLRLPLAVLPSAGVPISLSGPVGYVDTSFLDQELRISTGDKGSVFIAIRKREAL